MQVADGHDELEVDHDFAPWFARFMLDFRLAARRSRQPIVLCFALASCDHAFLDNVPQLRAPNDAAVGGCDPAAAPTSLAAQVFSDRVELTWHSGGDSDYGFIVERNRAATGWGEVGRVELSGAQAFTDAACVDRDAWCEYRVAAYKAACQTAPSPAMRVYTLPHPVSALIAQRLGPTAVHLGWQDTNQLETGHHVLRRGPSDGDYVQVAELAANTSSWDDATLARETAYDYRVLAFNTSGDAEPAAVLFWGAPNQATDLHAGVSLDASSPQSDVLLSWTDHNTFETGYRIERTGDGTTAELTSGAGTAQVYTHGDVALGDTLYTYSVFAQINYDAGGGVAASAESEAAVVQVETLPKAVSSLTATPSLGGSGIDLSFVDTNSHETAYVIERCLPAGGCSELSTLGADATGYQDASVGLDAQRTYGVYAVNATGHGPEVFVTAYTAPHTPTAPQAISVSTSEIDLSWSDDSVTTTVYKIVRNGTDVAQVTAPTKTYHDTLPAEGSYTYQVLATNPGAASAPLQIVGRTYNDPILAWDPPPTLDSSCKLTVLGTVTFDLDAAIVSNGASGTIDRCQVTNGAASGVSGTLTDLAAGPVAVSWTINDDHGGSATLSRALRLSYVSPVVATAVVMPSLSPGEDAMVGRQPWWPPDPSPGAGACSACAGTRGSIMAGGAGPGTCTLTVDGGATCWGRDASSCGGSVSHTLNPTPVCPPNAAGNHSTNWDTSGSTCRDCGGNPLAPLSGIRALAASELVGCAVTLAGGVKCWGNLPGPTAGGHFGAWYPMDLCTNGFVANCAGGSPVTGVLAIAIGGDHLCVLTDSGSGSGVVSCMGDNGFSQLGSGDTDSQAELVPVVCTPDLGADCLGNGRLGHIAAIAAGGYHTCALDYTGAVLCWGTNMNRECGNSAVSAVPLPQPVCASGNWSTLRQRCEINSSTPTTQLFNVVSIATRTSSTCALFSDGTLGCWGVNTWGQLGNGASGGNLANPVGVCASGTWNATNGDCEPAGARLSNVIAVAMGEMHACALLSGGTVDCWGYNNDGPLGDGTRTSRSNPVGVCASGSSAACASGPYLSDAVAITAASGHTCALRVDGKVSCWGFDQYGLLGDGTEGDSHNRRINAVDVCATGTGAACAGGKPLDTAAFRACGEVSVTTVP
jgi:hypothetical protein